MTNIILKLIALLLPVALGYFLKKIHFFGDTDYRILAKIALNITLPAAVISSFSGFHMDLSLLGVAVAAFAANWVVLLFIYFTSWRRKNDPKGRALQMFCGSGFNMGNFMIPFVQQFLGSNGVAVTAIFDSGNTFMCTGGIYIFTTSVVKTDGKKVTILSVLKKLMQPVLITYLIMIIMAIAAIPVPEFITTIVQPTGSANGFVSMMMIGLMFEIRFSKEYMKDAFGILGKKYFCAAVVALGFYCLLPFDLLTRQVMVMSAFAPIPSLAGIFTGQIDGDTGLAGFTTSCSFLISCTILTILAAVMGLA